MTLDLASTIRAWRRSTFRPAMALAVGLLAMASPALAQDAAQEAPVREEAQEAPVQDEAQEVLAQDEAPEVRRPAPRVALEPLPPPEAPPWPGVDRLAAALAAEPARSETLYTLAAMLPLRGAPRSDSAEAAEELARAVLSRRDWLRTLEGRFGAPTPRSAVLDPAAWQVQVQLDRVGLNTSLLASPLGPGQDVLLGPVFDRENPDLAAATLPELLWDLEVGAPMVWQGLVRHFDEDPWLAVALQRQAPEGFDWPRPIALSGATEPLDAGEVDAARAAGVATTGTDTADDPPAPEGPGAPMPDTAVLAQAQESLEVMLELAAGVGPPDPRRPAAVRQSLLQSLPDLDDGERARAAGLLHLVGVVEGLYRQNYLGFVEGLLAVAARLQDEAAFHPEQTRAFATWLAAVLPPLSARFGRAFSTVDPELNSVIATAYDVSRSLSREATEQDLSTLRVQIADAVAGLSLLIPDLGYYFDQPIRDPIAGGVDACTGIAGEMDADGTPSMTRDLFDDCQETLVSLANFQAREAQLAGNPDGPFGPSQLRRELGLTAGQRINYGIGYLHERYDTGCELPRRPLPNPLEWAYLATFMAWFAEQSPVYFQAPENEARLERMRGIGQELVREVTEQVDCLAGAGAVVNDPVDRVTTDYRTELRELARGLENARSAFRAERLAPGADLRLEGDAAQSTAYRPAELTIGPCDTEAVCEMSGALSSTRALTGLFPDPWLVADQSRLGQVEICYDDMAWVDRRMEPVRPGDENVANFFGRLAFDLRGRFRDESGATDLFAFRFVAPEESHYLFSAQSEEVLDDPCPVEWIGTRIVTELPSGRAGLVPNRLTYLSAARALPSRLLEANWDQGAEWRDWFVTGLGVEALSLPGPEPIGPRLDQHLQALYREEQATLYGALSAAGDGPRQLSEELAGVSTAKLLLRTQMMLFFPHQLVHSDRLREAVAGQNGLLDRRILSRARQQDLPVDELLTAGIERLEAFREAWRSQPESVRRRGSIADSVSHALVRLDAIQKRFFATPPAPGAVESVAALPGAEGQGDQVGDAQ